MSKHFVIIIESFLRTADIGMKGSISSCTLGHLSDYLHALSLNVLEIL